MAEIFCQAKFCIPSNGRRGIKPNPLCGIFAPRPHAINSPGNFIYQIAKTSWVIRILLFNHKIQSYMHCMGSDNISTINQCENNSKIKSRTLDTLLLKYIFQAQSFSWVFCNVEILVWNHKIQSFMWGICIGVSDDIISTINQCEKAPAHHLFHHPLTTIH